MLLTVLNRRRIQTKEPLELRIRAFQLSSRSPIPSCALHIRNKAASLAKPAQMHPRGVRLAVLSEESEGFASASNFLAVAAHYNVILAFEFEA